MSVFTTKGKQTEVEKLIGESKSIVDVFTKTATNLSTANAKLEKVKVRKEEEAKRLLEEKEMLVEQMTTNNKWIDKINSFLD